MMAVMASHFKKLFITTLVPIKKKKSWVYQTVFLLITGQGWNPAYIKKNTSDASFLSGLKPVVFIGRLLCVLSRSDVLKKHETQRKVTIPTVFSALFTLFFFINAILQILANVDRFNHAKTVNEKLGEFSLPSYSCTMFFVYFYQLFGTKRFRNVVQTFVEANQRSQLSARFPATFPRFCWITIVSCMLFGVAENVLFDLQNLKKDETLPKGLRNSTLELYYARNFYHWKSILPYHPVLQTILIIIVKFGTWGWVFMDIIAIVLSRAIAEKFRGMSKEIALLISQEHSAIITIIKSKTITTRDADRAQTPRWNVIRDEFTILSDLLLKIEEFIAPLILACYGANMYIIVISLFYWIAPYSKFSVEQSSYNYLAFMQFLFRVSSVTYFAAEVHHVSYKITKTIQKCPNSLYTLSLERLEKTLVSNPLGICLFGSFMITRRFFISIVSFIFTTEIVLLQTSSALGSTQKTHSQHS